MNSNWFQWRISRVMALGLCVLLSNAVLLVTSTVSWAEGSDAPVAEKVPFSTPPGIMIVEVTWASRYVHVVKWLRLGDAEGNSLFVSDKDEPTKSNCSGVCATDFPPVLALPDAVPIEDWSLVTRESGEKQWAYRGRPLYRFAGETRLNEIVDSILRKEQTDALQTTVVKEAESKAVLPEGWELARFDAVGALKLPGNMRIGDVPKHSSYALVKLNGKTIYRFAGALADIPKVACMGKTHCWQPVKAPAMAKPLGELKPIGGQDRTPQWSYKGQALFTYLGDILPGDINGVSKTRDPRWQVAAIRQHFMPSNATIQMDPMHGAILATSEGLPLYSRYVVESYNQPRNEDHAPYPKGKALGLKGCDRKCLETWRPFTAPANAKANGFWEVYDRGNGIRQWAYKGFAQFTNVNDKPAEPAVGNNSYVAVIGDTRYDISDTEPELHQKSFGSRFVWRVSDLHPQF